MMLERPVNTHIQSADVEVELKLSEVGTGSGDKHGSMHALSGTNSESKTPELNTSFATTVPNGLYHC